MELYIHSNDSKELQKAAVSGICAGIVLRHSDFPVQENVQHALKWGSEFSNIHMDVSGKNAEAICYEAHRILHEGMAAEKIVFRFPATWEGIQACKTLTKENYSVHLDAIGTLQQAWLAMEAGAQWIGINPGSLNRLGTDAMRLSGECLDAITRYSYETRLMLDAVHNQEQVAAALSLGADGIVATWDVIEQIAGSVFANSEAQHRLDRTYLLRTKVGDAVQGRNPVVQNDATVRDALREMSRGGLGAVAIVDANGAIKGIFTDGDLRRMLENEGEKALVKSISELPLKQPITIDADAILAEAQTIFRERKIDNLLVTQNGRLLGMLDIQDLNA
ncbi:MAG: CBS domain-containing protein [Bacteroidia bacterium]|jgi:transaldolase